MIVNRVKAILTEVYTTATWPCPLIIVYKMANAKTPRLRKKEYSITFRYHAL